jgi:hypothetical protein
MVYRRASLKDTVTQERFISSGYTQYVHKLYMVKYRWGKNVNNVLVDQLLYDNVLYDLHFSAARFF